eukprot:741270-Prorocentrum_minimum.AAC.1
MARAAAAVRDGRLSLRAEGSFMEDVGVRDATMDLLLQTYHPFWLRLAVETVLEDLPAGGGGSAANRG